MNSLIKWWFTPRFPTAQYKRILSYKPNGISSLLNYLIKDWIIHPIKRRIAKYYLILLKLFFGLKVIAITGSAGKTTTKEMVAAILKKIAPTVYSFANIDPVFNIPTTILKCMPSTKYLILEMGVEYPGEMDFYLWLAKPDLGAITNIYPTHTLYFKNIEGVTKEKVKLIKDIDKNGTIVLNNENKITKKYIHSLKGKIVHFGEGGDVVAGNIRYIKQFKTQFILQIDEENSNIKLPILGRQFVKNALAAASIANSLGLNINNIKHGLENFKAPAHRMTVKKLKSGTIIIDDAYNNNPSAARESLRVFKEVANQRKKIIVFGDMLELGNLEVRAHKEMGRFIASLMPSTLICIGVLSRNTFEEAKKKLKDKAMWVKDANEAYKILKHLITRKSIVLVKGSRTLGLERIVSRLS